uniref:Uncharacterized protein n=1 Tax=Acrobeloides nanus TaxID=290746 RepID=A0A914CD72_9BILA
MKITAYLFLALIISNQLMVSGHPAIASIATMAAKLWPIARALMAELGVGIVAGAAIGVALKALLHIIDRPENQRLVEGLFPIVISIDEQDLLFDETEWKLEPFFTKMGKAAGRKLDQLCFTDAKGNTKVVRKSEDHFALLLIWAIKMDGLEAFVC